MLKHRTGLNLWLNRLSREFEGGGVPPYWRPSAVTSAAKKKRVAKSVATRKRMRHSGRGGSDPQIAGPLMFES